MDGFPDNRYFVIGHWIGGLAASITFLGSWWYCASTYGYLFGFGLGWLPSLILAAISGLAVKILWAPLLLLIGAFAYTIIDSGTSQRRINPQSIKLPTIIGPAPEVAADPSQSRQDATSRPSNGTRSHAAKPDFARIKRNIAKMIDMGAPEADIDAYVAEEGVTPEQLRKAP